MTIGLGILLLNLHNPVYTAETVATLDIIARGNFIFGVGLGYRDYSGIGLPVFISILDAYTAKLKGLKPIPTGGLMGYAYAENVWLEG